MIENVLYVDSIWLRMSSMRMAYVNVLYADDTQLEGRRSIRGPMVRPDI
jgi:hypothetical protein